MKKQSVKVLDVQGWLRGFQASLVDRSNEVGVRLAGASAEQWLNTELFAYLAATLTGDLYPYTEYQKRDVTVFRRSNFDVAAIMETKVLYRSYSPSSVRIRIEKLSSQLTDAQKKNQASVCVGLVFAVFVKWPEDIDPRKHPASPEAFNDRLHNEFRQVKDLKFAKQQLLVEVDAVKVGGVEVPKVALYGQCVTLR